jgi:hypothetical protein
MTINARRTTKKLARPIDPDNSRYTEWIVNELRWRLFRFVSDGASVPARNFGNCEVEAIHRQLIAKSDLQPPLHGVRALIWHDPNVNILSTMATRIA